MSEAHQPQAPNHKVLGSRYRLQNIIGRGGSATVFEAVDESLGRHVAVKLFNGNSLESGREQGELQVLASLEHHALVQMYDAGADADEYGRTHRYLVMALIHGSDLHQRIGVAPLTPRHIAEVGYDMAEALDYIHAHNIIHRDIKPSNILLVDYGDGSTRARAKLTDFGIALAEDVERLTAEGATTGTAGYLSPEQASGRPVGPESDVYSLGLVLLECFTRHLEFPGSVVESAIARLSRDPYIPEALPEIWKRLLGAMTARDPKLRPTRHDLVAALRQVVIAESGRHKDAEAMPVFPAAPDALALARPNVLDTLPDEALDRVTAMAARLFQAPLAVVSVVDHDRVWLKAHYSEGVPEAVREVDLSHLPASHPEPVVIEDGWLDPRTSENVLVTGEFGMRFYVSVPLKRSSGDLIGTLSVIDVEPGSASDEEIANLTDLAALVVSQLEMRRIGLRTTSEILSPLPH